MKLRSIAAPMLFLAATGAVAPDMLPLAPGIYVTVGTPCPSASNADTLSYWGGRNGINDQQTSCRIDRLMKAGSTYSLQRTWRSLRFGGTFHDRMRITVANRRAFAISGRGDPRTFRYCGPRVQS
jgi:hypothetical protein